MSRTLICCGDGVCDVTACIQATIDRQPAGAVLRIPAPLVAYNIGMPLVISKPITILGEQSLIRQTTPGVGAFLVKSSGVKLRGLNLQGKQFTKQATSEVAIQAAGPSAQSNLLDLEVSDCVISNWGMWGILASYVDGFLLQNCKISNVYYGGIGGASVLNGNVNRCKIKQVVGAPNAYGIIMSRNVNDPTELQANPFSSNVLIDDNDVNGVASWEGIDTHAGRKIIISDNRVTNCARGIVVTDCPNSKNVHIYGPKDCVVKGNVCDSGVTNGTAVYGIVVSGCSAGVGTPTDLAEACVVEGNVVRGFGFSESANGLAIYLVSTRGLSFCNNAVIEPGKIGIAFDYNNWGFTCTGNVVQDPWSESQGTIAVSCRSDYNRGFIGGNSYVRGSKTATHVLEQGVYVASQPNNLVTRSADYSDVVVRSMLRDNAATLWQWGRRKAAAGLQGLARRIAGQQAA